MTLLTSINLDEAEKHFAQVDKTMALMLRKSRTAKVPLSIPKPKRHTTYFSSIAHSIISQQISTKAADAVSGRLRHLVGAVTPEHIKERTMEELRLCGLSSQKASYLKTSADIWPTLAYQKWRTWSDEAIITELTRLHGVGRWTAEMFLIFTLARPDIFSWGDLGLVQELHRAYALKPQWTRKAEHIVEVWKPHQTVASLVLWHHRDGDR